jgi:hypothetical protein
MLVKRLSIDRKRSYSGVQEWTLIVGITVSYLLPHSPYHTLQRKKECAQLWRVADEGNGEATPEGMQLL